MKDLELTSSQAKSLACVASQHPDCTLVIFPPVAGCIGVQVRPANGSDTCWYMINADGTPEPSVK